MLNFCILKINMTTLCTIPLSSCLMNASGCYSSTIEQLKELDCIFKCGAIVSKSCTISPQTGNELPRLYTDESICINSMGLPNFGCKYYSNITLNKLHIQSVYPKNINVINVVNQRHLYHVYGLELPCLTHLEDEVNFEII